MSKFNDALDQMIGELGIGRILFDREVAKHLGSSTATGRLLRVENLPDPLTPGSRAEFAKRLPELEAARREGRLLEGELDGNMLRDTRLSSSAAPRSRAPAEVHGGRCSRLRTSPPVIRPSSSALGRGLRSPRGEP